MSEHTPTPYLLDEEDPLRVRSEDYGTVAWVVDNADAFPDPDQEAAAEAYREEAEATARFFVRACNSHDELVGVARDAVNTLAILTSKHPSGKKNTLICKTLDKLTVALAAAEAPK